MRRGAYPCNLEPGSLARKAYGRARISERHRHRYEFNNAYRDKLTSKGMCLSGFSPDGLLVEVVELPKKGFYLGVQFHPEFKSRPNKAHPLFRDFFGAAHAYSSGKSKQ